jgi:hypothetical protein
MNSGASAWMGEYLEALMGPRSSMGSPMTFMIRPSVPGYTIQNPSDKKKGAYPYGNLDGSTSGFDGLTTDKTFGTVHGNTSNRALSQMLGDFENESLAGRGL